MLIQNTIRKFIFTAILMCTILIIPINSYSFEFYGGLYRKADNVPLTVAWDDQGATGYELKMVHFFYTGLETETVETIATSYTFPNFPRSSRHFEIKVRSYNEDASGHRVYSDWSSSTNAACSVVDGQSGGWLIYTYPGAPIW